MPMQALPLLASVSFMPGLCMMLALNLGMQVGVLRTLWMMIGELAGIGVVAGLALSGISALMFAVPETAKVITVLCAAYLFYLGVRIALTRPARVAEGEADAVGGMSRWHLARTGFLSAVTNPKAWILYASLLPPFIEPTRAVAPQFLLIILLLLVVEFVSLVVYASGGRTLGRFVTDQFWLRAINVLSGGVIIAFAAEILAI